LPVTAKLSRKFYDRFGDDVAGELVDWFNAVASTYQAQLREMNDLNWERYKAFVDARIAELRRDVDAAIARSEKGIRSDFDALRREFADFRAEMLKWMFVYWTGSVITLGGLMFFLLKTR
jgi:hypothetical protein